MGPCTTQVLGLCYFWSSNSALHHLPRKVMRDGWGGMCPLYVSLGSPRGHGMSGAASSPLRRRRFLSVTALAAVWGTHSFVFPAGELGLATLMLPEPYWKGQRGGSCGPGLIPLCAGSRSRPVLTGGTGRVGLVRAFGFTTAVRQCFIVTPWNFKLISNRAEAVLCC